VSNEPQKKSWQSDVGKLLARAAQVAAEAGVDMDAFMKGAATAYFDARPGMREYLEEMQLRATLQQLRDDGRIASA
jgi:hypothetical protein